MKIINAEFIKGAVKAEQFPEIGVSEFAFFGRSNAGKSSLINMLVNRKNLVKTGSRPGMTREVNFFLVNRPASINLDPKTKKISGTAPKDMFVLTDLPGYGYAKLSGGMTLQIDKMLYEYCINRPLLKAIFFLMDMRREPTETEKESIGFFHGLNIEVVIVGTKADKIGKNDQIKAKNEWSSFFNFDEEHIIISSAAKKTGRDNILSLIAKRI
ncbi:ribosome biogenesis GTP-binding protein YsxC [Treponema putidum]|uniref:ribosome biogenesis GTP-binding protein YihA/YsxC n=1 Tax=Treponema putidum TaxID=221027 RepID=UPI0004F619A5|nr:ribosome biogenesis GTP-binding protein YihA/YsxC [Treponema putidum]AIN93112.1 GTP-binding protein EngB [Treponema putidum]TWI78595.1 GTP-binding protein [Treponema putidum]